MKYYPLWVGFLLASSATILQSALLPGFPLLAYAPFLALSCIHASFSLALWLAFIAGLSQDFLGSDPFGIYALTFVLTAAILHRLELRVLKENVLQLCVMSAFASFFFTPLFFLLLFLFDKRPPCSGNRILVEFFLRPLTDAVYSFAWFVGPLLVIERMKKTYIVWRLKRRV